MLHIEGKRKSIRKPRWTWIQNIYRTEFCCGNTLKGTQKRTSKLSIQRRRNVRPATWLQFLGLWSSYGLGMAPRCCLHQFGRSLGATDDGHVKAQSRWVGLVTVCTFRLSYSYSKYCQVLTASLLCKILIHLILLKEAWEGGCANLAVLGFGRHSHHPGSWTDLKCNILLSEKLWACSFSVVLTEASIFAKHKVKILQIQPKAICYSCNTILTHSSIQWAFSNGIPSFGFAPSMHLQLCPPLWGVENNLII